MCDYEVAFSRHSGLISSDEQEVLKNSRVAIVGMGGVGGIHLITLARLGIGSFNIADPDVFEMVNFNRQYGANICTIGKKKSVVMAEEAMSINPNIDLITFGAITKDNTDCFLHDVDILIDGIDFFAINARRLLYREARRKGIWVITAAPLGFSTAWLCFSPTGMTFDEYFDLHDDMPILDQLVAFAVGLAPRATHLAYMNLSSIKTLPSLGLACNLCGGVTATQVVKLLLNRGRVPAAPHYFQFDPYRYVLRRGRLWFGNRGPLQRLKRRYLRKKVGNLTFADFCT